MLKTRSESKSVWRFLWRSEDVRRRILITLGLIVLYRALLTIPLPGITTSPEEIRNHLTPGSGLFTMVEFISMLSGSSLLTVSVLALGLLPFNLANLLLQFSIPLIPRFQRRLQEDPREGRLWLEKWSYYLTIPAAIFEAFLFLFLISPNCEGRFFLLEGGAGHPDILFSITTVILLVVGSFFAIWMASLISEFGIRGQGNAILIASGIIGQMSNEFVRLLRIQLETTSTVEGAGLVMPLPGRILELLFTEAVMERLVWYALLFVLCIVAVVYLQQGRRNVPVEFPGSYNYRRLLGSRSIRMPRPTLPLMLTIGTDGLVASQLLVMLSTFYAPLMTCSGLPLVNSAANWIIGVFGVDNPLFGPIAFLSVFGFTYFYADLAFQSQNYGDNLRRNHGVIPGVNGSAATQAYLTRINRRITFLPALMLGFLAIAPWMFELGFGVKLSLLEGEKILIIVGVIRDIFMNLDAELTLRGYDERLLIR